MYLVVRESLNMSPGKLAVQCGHAVDMLCEKSELAKNVDNKERAEYLIESFAAWRKDNQRVKITLKADEKEWEKLHLLVKDQPTIEYVVVRDAGRTEIPTGSETVMGFWPMTRSSRPKLLCRLQKL